MILREELQREGNLLFKYRSYFPVIIILAGLSVYINSVTTAYPIYWLYPYTYLCFTIGFIGLIIRVISVGYSADNTSGRNTSSGQIADEINSTGMYSICRHPLYLGNFFMWLGVALLTINPWFISAFGFLYWIYYERIMYAEEAYLLEKYGDKYKNWAADRPTFIPKLSLWESPTYTFSWVKVIRQEKTGILNLFLLFFIFNGLGEYLNFQEITFQFKLWGAGLALGILWYLVIKIIQKNTTLLKKDRK